MAYIGYNRSIAAVSALAIGTVLALSACSRQAAPPPANPPVGKPLVADLRPVQGDWVVLRIDSDPDILNPLITQTTNGQMISTPWIVEGMLHLNNYTLKLEPALAESWEISPDKLTYTFHLRHGVRWHDGVPFTADDVKFSYDKLMDPKSDTAPMRSYFTTIKSCEVIDPYTVRFTATQPYFKTLEVLGSGGYLAILPKHVYEKGDPDFNRNNANRAPIGTGPYKFVRWDTGSQIVLERNDDYWGGNTAAYPKRLVFQVLQEAYVAAQLVKKGEIDAFDEVSPTLWKYDMQSSPSMAHLKKIVYPFPSYYYLGFNLRDPLFADVRVRHAIDLLMPRDKIIDQFYFHEYAIKTSGFDPPSSPTYNKAILPTPYDPAQALQLLTEAGWKNDHGDGILYKDGQPFSFTLLYPAGSAGAEKEAELDQEALRSVGIDMKLTRLEFAQMIDTVNDWKFQAMLGAWSLDTNGDPWQLWNSADADVKKSSNFLGYKSAKADALMNAAKLEYDDDKRAAIYQQLHQVIHDDYPCCFLIVPLHIMLVSDRYQNVQTFVPRPCFDISQWWVPRDLQKYGN